MTSVSWERKWAHSHMDRTDSIITTSDTGGKNHNLGLPTLNKTEYESGMQAAALQDFTYFCLQEGTGSPRPLRDWFNGSQHYGLNNSFLLISIPGWFYCKKTDKCIEVIGRAVVYMLLSTLLRQPRISNCRHITSTLQGRLGRSKVICKKFLGGENPLIATFTNTDRGGSTMMCHLCPQWTEV